MNEQQIEDSKGYWEQVDQSIKNTFEDFDKKMNEHLRSFE